MSDIVDVVVQVVTAVGGLAGIGALFNLGIQRRAARAKAAGDEAAADKKTADAGRVITDTAVGLLEPLKDQVADLRKDLKAAREESVLLRADVRGLHDYVTLLIDVIEAAGLPIPPKPVSLLLAAPDVDEQPETPRRDRRRRETG